jgi:hypothetical protein
MFKKYKKNNTPVCPPPHKPPDWANPSCQYLSFPSPGHPLPSNLATMEDSKGSGGADTPGAGPNPTPNQPPPAAASRPDDDAAAVAAAAAAQADDEARRPFTALSQVDADLALARVLQDQASATRSRGPGRS